MKSTEFKKIIKEAVREVIQEELKDILLEAVKSPKPSIQESYSPLTSTTHPPVTQQPNPNLRQKYMDVLGETALGFTSQDVPRFSPQGTDPVNGNLGNGEVSMDQIMNLMSTK